ncbi:hypothetical protein FTUN_8266 [Frigoriglobus tundricola]|uniref:Uncharacterized protein n=1 Tax=Frigoriglobus tundricola TaxID=2774151 RepID=A0A6M5Z5B4_9BACT|nr:hypothetical protein FTUN_8266 [Frigoriglobus tundricola]
MDTLDAFIRENGMTLRWVATVAWFAAALGAVRLVLGPCGRSRRTWLVIAAATLGFAVETACHLRFEGTELFRAVLRDLGGTDAYGNRRLLQAAVILGCVLPVAAFLVVRTARARFLTPAAKVAALGTGCASVGFVLETISLHQLDQIPFLYQACRFGGLGLVLLGVGTDWLRARSAHGVPQAERPT